MESKTAKHIKAESKMAVTRGRGLWGQDRIFKGYKLAVSSKYALEIQCTV